MQNHPVENSRNKPEESSNLILKAPQILSLDGTFTYSFNASRTCLYRLAFLRQKYFANMSRIIMNMPGMPTSLDALVRNQNNGISRNLRFQGVPFSVLLNKSLVGRRR